MSQTDEVPTSYLSTVLVLFLPKFIEKQERFEDAAAKFLLLLSLFTNDMSIDYINKETISQSVDHEMNFINRFISFRSYSFAVTNSL